MAIIPNDLSDMINEIRDSVPPPSRGILGKVIEPPSLVYVGIERFPANRKSVPLCTGVLDYFPDALIEVAKVSVAGNEQHNPGQPLHWAKEKSTDHSDCILRHLVERGTNDTDGVRHSAKLAWRALALLQTEIEKGPS